MVLVTNENKNLFKHFPIQRLNKECRSMFSEFSILCYSSCVFFFATEQLCQIPNFPMDNIQSYYLSSYYDSIQLQSGYISLDRGVIFVAKRGTRFVDGSNEEVSRIEYICRQFPNNNSMYLEPKPSAPRGNDFLICLA